MAESVISILVILIMFFGVVFGSSVVEKIAKALRARKAYKGFALEIGFPEGFSLLDKRPNRGTPFEGAGEILGWKSPEGEGGRDAIISLDKYPIRMFVKVVGFRDYRAPKRDWGDSIYE